MNKILHDLYMYLRFRKEKYNIRFIEYITYSEINPFEGIHIIENDQNEYMVEKVK